MKLVRKWYFRLALFMYIDSVGVLQQDWNAKTAIHKTMD